jgi:hypothetical protein
MISGPVAGVDLGPLRCAHPLPRGGAPPAGGCGSRAFAKWGTASAYHPLPNLGRLANEKVIGSGFRVMDIFMIMELKNSRFTLFWKMFVDFIH